MKKKICINIMNEKILFITSTRIGDAVLSSGVLRHLIEKYPSARFTIACGPLVVSMFEGVPRLDKIIALKKRTYNRHWIELWRMVVGQKWDVVVDLRNSAVSRLICADKRYIHGAHISKKQHKVLQNAEVINCLDAPPAPILFITSAQAAKARELIPDGTPVLGIGPTANWIGKMWPVERFTELLNKLMADGGRFHGWRVAVFSAPDEEHIAQKIYEKLSPDIRINLMGKGTPNDAAACLTRCGFYIGNDSGLMHCAAAGGIPTLGLFGPTNDQIYAPYGDRAMVVRTVESLNQLIGAPDFNPKNVTSTLMNSLSVDAVYDKLTNF